MAYQLNIGKNKIVKEKEIKEEIKKEKKLPDLLIEAKEDKEDTIPEVTKPAPIKFVLNDTIQKQKEKDVELFNSAKDSEYPKEFYELEGFNPNEFEENILGLASEMEAEDPQLRSYLKLIYNNLKQFPQLAHLLNDVQLGLIFRSFQKAKNIEISTKAPTAPTATSVVKQMNNSDMLNLDF